MIHGVAAGRRDTCRFHLVVELNSVVHHLKGFFLRFRSRTWCFNGILLFLSVVCHLILNQRWRFGVADVVIHMFYVGKNGFVFCVDKNLVKSRALKTICAVVSSPNRGDPSGAVNY